MWLYEIQKNKEVRAMQDVSSLPHEHSLPAPVQELTVCKQKHLRLPLVFKSWSPERLELCLALEGSKGMLCHCHEAILVALRVGPCQNSCNVLYLFHFLCSFF